MVDYLKSAVFDVPPEPIVRRISVLPFVLIAAVVIVSVILLRKYFGKR